MLTSVAPSWRDRLRRSRMRALMLVPAFALVTLICWAFASPIGSSPDDDFHLASSWCAMGIREGICEEAEEPSARMVPAEVAYSAICYAYNPEQSAACQSESWASVPDMVQTDRGNFTGLYPPVFYAVTGFLATPDVESATLTMRILSATLFVVMATALALLLPSGRRSTLIWAWFISTTPLGIFLLASNNPSAWAIISAGSLWIALVGFFESTGARRVALGSLAFVAMIIGAGARSDAAVYSALGAVVAVVLTFERSRKFLMLCSLPLVIIGVSTAFYFGAAQGTIAASGSESAPTHNLFTIVLANLVNLPLLWEGAFGSTGLGWLDTPMPGVVTVGAFFCFAAVAFAGLHATDLRKRLALALVALALVAFPSFVLMQARALVGAYVQPRYILPLVVMLAGVALFAVEKPMPRLSGLQRNVVVATLIAAHAAALHFTIRRYVTGLDVGSWNLGEHVEWWWNDGSPMLVWIVGSLAFAAAAVLASLHLTTPAWTDSPRSESRRESPTALPAAETVVLGDAEKGRASGA